MDSFELNKILGAILGTLLFVMGGGFLAEAIYNPATAGAGYALPEAAEAAESGGDAAAAPVDIGTLLAAADPTEGAASAKKCQACHDVTEGGPNKTGPNLYDVVERVMGSHPGFAYSDAMLAHQASGDTWTYERLNAFLISPKADVPGTKMTFAGVKNDQERANIIAFLSTLSQSPKPFPAAAAPAEVAAPASGQVVEGASSTEAVETPSDASAAAPGGSGTTNTEVAPAAPTATPASSAAPVSSEAPAASSAAQ